MTGSQEVAGSSPVYSTIRAIGLLYINKLVAFLLRAFYLSVYEELSVVSILSVWPDLHPFDLYISHLTLNGLTDIRFPVRNVIRHLSAD